DLRDDRATPGRTLGDGDGQVGQAVLEVDAPEILALRPCDKELGASGEVRAAADPVGLQRRGPNLLFPACFDVAHSADRAVTVEEPMAVLASLLQSGGSPRRS